MRNINSENIIKIIDSDNWACIYAYYCLVDLDK